VISAICDAENTAIRFLRNTAFTLDTTAVTISKSRSAIMGKLKSVVANVSAAKTISNTEPTAEYAIKARVSFYSSGMKALTIMQERDYTKRMTIFIKVNTVALPGMLRTKAKLSESRGGVDPSPKRG